MTYNKLELAEKAKILVPSFRDELGTRLRSVEKLFKNRLEAATAAGVAKSTLQSWVEGKVSPSFEGLAQLSKVTGISLDWLATGKGPMKDGDPVNIFIDDASPLASLDQDFVLIPRLSVSVSAGGGTLVDTEQVLDYMAFRSDWITNRLHVDPANLMVVTAKGDSMTPGICDGDVLLINTGVNRFSNDAIYVIEQGGEAYVKRVQRLIDGSVVIKSDNPSYSPQRLTSEEAEAVRIAGQVRWIGHTC